MSKYIFIGLKKTCLGVLRIEEIRDKDNETGLKEGWRNRNLNYSAFHIRDARSIRFCIYLPLKIRPLSIIKRMPSLHKVNW